MKNIALVTGANGGFGKEFVKLLNKEKGLNEVWCIARNEKTLDELKETYGKKIITHSIDLGKQEGLNQIKELINQDVNIKYLVNNAGFGKFGACMDVDTSIILNMIDVNVKALVYLCEICVSKMGKGSHIINISSLSAFLPLPYLNVYSASKVFVRNYSRALGMELKCKGISVTAVCPGWMSTNFIGTANTDTKKTGSNYFGIVTPDKVAIKAMKDAKAGKSMSVYGFTTKLIHMGSKICPQSIAMKMWIKTQKF